MTEISPLLEIQALHCGYGQLEVLHGVSISVRPQQIVAIIGANGAGKSTLLMAVSGEVKASQGKITASGRDITSLPTHQRVQMGIVQVPEGRRIFSRMTVLENLMMGAFLRRDRAQIDRDLQFGLTLFPILKERRSQVAGTLSGGEQQMLAIARALMSAPRVLLLDEPSMGVAPKLVAEIFRVISELPATGISVVLVEQNAQSALQIAKHAYVLETGRITLEGAAAELALDERVKQAYLGS